MLLMALNVPRNEEFTQSISSGDGKIPNCDKLCHTLKKHFSNWQEIAAKVATDNGEIDAIQESASVHARMLRPPQPLGLVSIGGADQFANERRPGC